jgi:orotate phosphoribosyltransferase
MAGPVEEEADLSRGIAMGQDMKQELLSLVAARRGHFELESGYHAPLWLDLNALFLQPARLRPFVAELAASLQGYDLAGVCGPLLGGAFLAQTLASSLGVEFFFTERTTPSEPGGLYRVQYGLPPALRDRALGKRIAIVDDVISAGSAVRGSYAELQTCGAQPVVVGALLLLGSVAQRYFDAERVPLKAAVQMDFDLWVLADCPLCAAQVSLEDPTALVASRTTGAS